MHETQNYISHVLSCSVSIWHTSVNKLTIRFLVGSNLTRLFFAVFICYSGQVWLLKLTQETNIAFFPPSDLHLYTIVELSVFFV